MRTYEINGEQVIIEISRYMNNTSLAICLETPEEGHYAVLSVNIDESDFIKENECFVDTNNCPWAEEFIKKYDLAKFTGVYGESGFCTYPLYDFSKFVKQYIKDLIEEIKMPATVKTFRVYKTSFNTFNMEITRDKEIISTSVTTEQMNKLLDVLSTNGYENNTMEDDDEE